MPSQTYHPGQPVSIYYEVYGLTVNEFGQTHYEMDYQIAAKKGKPIAGTILRAIGELLGIEEKKVVTIYFTCHRAIAHRSSPFSCCLLPMVAPCWSAGRAQGPGDPLSFPARRCWWCGRAIVWI